MSNASLEEYQIRLEALHNVYIKSKARLAGEDPEWNARKQHLETKAWREIKSFGPDDQPSKAVLIIGRVQSIAAEIDAARMNVAEYEDMHKRYVRLCETEDKKPDLTL